MAIGRLSIKSGKTGKAAPHAEYIARMGKYAGLGEARAHGSADRVPERLESTEAGNMPAWARHDPLLFWKASDQHERANGSTYREMEIALPRELSPAQRADLVRTWVDQELGGKHAYQWAIHVPKAIDGGEQPHLHLMFSERQIDDVARDPEQYFRRYNAKNPERGGSRKGFQDVAVPHGPARSAARAEQLKALRERWGVACNQALEQAGRSERIDMRSHAERGTGLVPEPKAGPKAWRNPARRAEIIEFRAARAARVAALAEVARLVPDAGAEIIQLEVARRKRAEREQCQAMPMAELRRHVIHLHPLDPLQLVDRRPEVQELAKRLREAREQEAQAAAASARSTAALNKWQKLHPAKAWLHRQGLWLDTSAQELNRAIELQRAALAAASAAQVSIASELQAQRVQMLPAAEREHQEMVDRHARASGVLREREAEHVQELAARKVQEQAGRGAAAEALRTARQLDIVAGLLQTGRISEVGTDLRQVLDSYARLGHSKHERITGAAQRMTDKPALLAQAQQLLQPHQGVIEIDLESGQQMG